MRCPTPLRDLDLLRYIEETHESLANARQPGNFAIEFHYDSEGRLSTVHRGPVVRTRFMRPAAEVLTLE